MRKSKASGLVLNEGVVANKPLTTKARKDLSTTEFALPEERKYPIPDENHARDALARVAQHGTPEEKKKVRAAVHRKFPNIAEAHNAAEGTLTLNEGHFEYITFNITPGVNIRHAQLEGRNYTVVPMVMITEGVHAGSNGPLYYPAEELSKTPAVWNHKPLIVYHPDMGHSACEHAVLETSKVGIIMNTKYEPARGGNAGKLKAEAWIENDRVNEVDERVAETIQNQSVMEVSTGLFMDFEETSGVWGKSKKPYDIIARNYRPDHLAILPDQTGACSIADGAGLLRNSAMSHDAIRDQLHEALRSKKLEGMDGPYVNDVFDKFCVYSHGGKMYKQDYAVDESGKVGLTGKAEEVIRKQQYKTVSGKVLNTLGVTTMNKQEMISALIANEALGFEDKDKPWLNGLSEAYLKKMLPAEEVVENVEGEEEEVENAANPSDADEDTEKDAEYGDKGSGKGKGKKDKKMAKNAAQQQPVATTVQNAEPTVDEYLAAAPPAIRQVIFNALEVEKAEKKKLVEVIVANKANVFKPEALARKELNELRAIARLAAPAVTKNTVQSDYNFTGMGDVTTNAMTDEEALPLPTWNYSKKEAVAADAE